MPLRTRRRHVVPAVLLTLALGVSACSQTTSHLDEHNEVPHGNAQPAEAPQASDPTEGEVVEISGAVRALVATGDLLVAQVDEPARLEMGRVDGTTWTSERIVELPEDSGTASTAADGTVLVPHSDGLVVVPPSGSQTDLTGLGPVTAAAMTADGRILTGNDDGDVVVRDSEGVEQHRVSGLNAVDRITVARDGSVTALSRPDTIVASIDLSEDQAGPLLRAGKGAGMLTAFSEGSVVASDTVGGALLVYSTSPVRLHQMFPVAAAPWAVAEDPSGGLVWVGSTGTNTVQAYDLRNGTGDLTAEVATVRQPDSLTVTDSGTVVVGSADGAGLHLFRPSSVTPTS